MRINAISLMPFSGKQQMVKKGAQAAIAATGLGASAAAADKLSESEFKNKFGFSMPKKNDIYNQDRYIKAYDEGPNPCDPCVDECCEESCGD